MEPSAVSADQAAIKRVTEAWDSGWRDADASALASLLGEDAVLMPQNQPAIVGREAIQPLYQSIFDGFTVTGSGGVIGVEVAGRLEDRPADCDVQRSVSRRAARAMTPPWRSSPLFFA